MAREGQRVVGLDDSDDIATRGDKRVGDREEEGAGAGDDDASAGQHTAALDECLRATAGHHARQSPTGEGQLPVEGPGRDHDRPCRDGLRLTTVTVIGARAQDEAALLALQRIRIGGHAHVDPTGVDEPIEVPPQRRVGQPGSALRSLRSAVVLTADRGSAVEERHRAAGAGSDDRGGHASGAAAHDEHVSRHIPCPPGIAGRHRVPREPCTRAHWARH